MAWVSPSFVYGHAIKDAFDAGTITAITTVGTEDADFPLENLTDFRVGSVFKWTDSSALHVITLDRGASPDEVDYIWFSAGSNLSIKSFNMEHSATGAWAGEESSVAGSTVIFASTTAGWGVSMASASSLQYLRVNITSTGAWEIPEIVIGKRFAPVGLPDLPYSNDPKVASETFEKASGAAAILVRGPQLETWRLEYSNVGETAADLTSFDALISYTKGVVNPFLFSSPLVSGVNTANLYRMTSMPTKEFDHPVPNSGSGNERYRFGFEFKEYIA